MILRKRIHIKVYVLVLITVLLSALFLLFGWAVWHQSNGGNRLGKLGKYVIDIATIPNALLESAEAKSPVWETNKTKQTTNFVSHQPDSGYLLIPAYDKTHKQFVIKLFSLAAKQTVHTWIPDLKAIAKLNEGKGIALEADLLQPISFKTQHPILTSDKGLIIKGGYGLMKLNKDSKIEWFSAGNFHHATEQDHEGNYWTAGMINPTALDTNLFPKVKDDAIVKFNPQGEVLFKKSIASILIENGAMYLLAGIGLYEEDMIHVNDVQPVLVNTTYAQQGDVFINIRNRSTLILYSPATNKIKWLQTGPWSNEHDVSLIDSVRIGVLGNNVIRHGKKRFQFIHGYNSFYIYNFATKQVDTPYNAIMRKYDIATKSEGRICILKNGDLFIEESNNGRLMRVNDNQPVWSYMEIIDKTNVSILGWSRYYERLPW
ncbi:hypothetical protein CAP35_02840 [Chitinophagaceae bacterium IBVUCB1]|nr:hypothetical protein CAP35_02840 [Chitinophagaceae bacterium IBVUCB1]